MSTIIIGGPPDRFINEVFVIVAIGPDGKEGIPAMSVDEPGIPFSSRKTLESMKEAVRNQIAPKSPGTKFVVRAFSASRDVETL